MVEVGKEYVLGYKYSEESFAPTQCNSEYNPEHHCRVVLAKLGKKWGYALMTGYTKPTKISLEALHEISDAKRMYRASLEKRDAKWKAAGETCMLGVKRINRLVEDL